MVGSQRIVSKITKCRMIKHLIIEHLALAAGVAVALDTAQCQIHADNFGCTFGVLLMASAASGEGKLIAQRPCTRLLAAAQAAAACWPVGSQGRPVCFLRVSQGRQLHTQTHSTACSQTCLFSPTEQSRADPTISASKRCETEPECRQAGWVL